MGLTILQSELCKCIVTVGNLLIDPIHLPEPTKIITSKQYHIPGGHREITQTIKDYVNAGVIIPTTSAWNNPIWPVRKSEGSWRWQWIIGSWTKSPPHWWAPCRTLSLWLSVFGLIQVLGSCYWSGWRFLYYSHRSIPMGTICLQLAGASICLS